MRSETAELETTVSLLVGVSRDLMREKDLMGEKLWSNRSQDIPTDASPQARAAHVGESIISLMRKGARPNDLSFIYLAWCNLRGMSLPGVDFDDSILAGCDFSGANLAGASFNGTDLSGVRFEEADLRNAYLVNTAPVQGSRPNYMLRSFEPFVLPKQQQVVGPDFSCADLRGADFKGHAIFGFSENGLDRGMFVPAHFYKANLDRADFRFSRAYGVFSAKGFFPFNSSGNGQIVGNIQAFSGTIDPPLLPDKIDKFSISLSMISDMFAGSNWQSAQLPGPITEVLKRNPPLPTLSPTPGVPGSSCTPRW
jgi:uncharacterized protein YjbI with pentapeptide repeats